MKKRDLITRFGVCEQCGGVFLRSSLSRIRSGEHEGELACPTCKGLIELLDVDPVGATTSEGDDDED